MEPGADKLVFLTLELWFPFETTRKKRGNVMGWITPVLVEICIGMEINGYLPAEF